MNRLTLLLFIGFLPYSMLAQDTLFNAPDAVINGFFDGLSEQDDSIRRNKLTALFIPDGLVNATLHQDAYSPKQNLGSLETFLTNAAPYYVSHQVSYDEADRSVDYYQDIIMIHSLVYQVMEETTSQVEYEQWLWFVFDLAYQNNRWFITSASWVNAFDGQPINEAMLQDTLWHQPEN